jgi:hypothetical protein
MRQFLPGAPSAARQYDLFASATEGGAKAVLPEWATLPEETRQMLTSFLTRVFLDHASADHPSQSEEARP